MDYWQMVYTYFVDQGFPEALLDFVCIHQDEADQITTLIESKQPDSILEIGTFIGLSTGVLALASAPTSTLVCVDPNFPVDIFSNNFKHPESRGCFEFVRTMLEHFGIHQKVVLLEGYFSCISVSYQERFIAQGGNTDLIESNNITVVGERTGEYAPYDLVFVDGDHSLEFVYSDLSLVHRYLSEDGIIILHDLDPRGHWGKDVAAGVTQFLQNYAGFSIIIHENLGLLYKET